MKGKALVRQVIEAIEAIKVIGLWDDRQGREAALFLRFC
jgi:hypothetical protein